MEATERSTRGSWRRQRAMTPRDRGADISALHSEAQALAQRLRRLAVALAITEEALADLPDASALDVRQARRMAHECRRFLMRLDELGEDTRPT